MHATWPLGDQVSKFPTVIADHLKTNVTISLNGRYHKGKSMKIWDIL